jgi:hypothetical protein
MPISQIVQNSLASGVPSSVAKSALPAGTVLQVIQGSTTTQNSTSSSTPSSTGLSLSITPSSASSKILVMFSLGGVLTNSSAFGLGLYVYRNGSAVWSDVHPYDSAYNNSNGSALRLSRLNMQYLDSPATTSACTYAIYFAAYTGTIYSQDSNAESRITLMEVAG